HALYQRWQGKQMEKWTSDRLAKERAQALKYVKDNAGMAFGWAMLTLLQDRADKDQKFYGQLAEHWPLFQKGGLGYTARYEEARWLFRAGQKKAAREKFTVLYNDTLKDGYLPAIDSDGRAALLSGPGAADWGELMQGTAKKLIADKKR